MYGYPDECDHDDAPPATLPEALREWACNVGGYDRYKDSQWILTDYDTWERNPHYNGPEQGHPEDDAWVHGPTDFDADDREVPAYAMGLSAYELDDAIPDGPTDDDIPF